MLQLSVITPEEKLFEGEATVVTLPGVGGSFQIMNNHAPIVAALGKGTLKIEADTNDKSIEIKGGFVELLNNKLNILVRQSS